MPTIQELQDKRQKLAAKIREQAAKLDKENGEWKEAEDQAVYDQLNADYDATMAQMSNAQRVADVQARVDALTQDDQLPTGATVNDDGADLMNRLRAAQPQPRHERPIPNRDQLAMAGIAAWLKMASGHELTQHDQEYAKAAGVNLRRRVLDLHFPPAARFGLNQTYRKYAATHPTRRGDFTPDFDHLYNAPLTTTDPATGGVLVPSTLLASLEVAMLAYGGMREVSQIMVTPDGGPLSWPTANDTGNKGRIVAENTAADDNAGGGTSGDGGPNPAFDAATWGAFKYTSDTILVPYELLEDSVVDLMPILGEMLGERIGRITNEHYTVGTDSGQPMGLFSSATIQNGRFRAAEGVVAASASAITWQETIDLQHSVDPAYRNGAVYMAHDKTVAYLRKLSDAEDRPIWQSGLQAGTPDLINGSPAVVNQDMADTFGVNAKMMGYGPPGSYKIRRVNGLRLYWLQERYREKDQDGIVAFLREDGNLLDAGVTPWKYLAMAPA